MIVNGYTSLETLKTHLAIHDVVDDAALEVEIEASSRWIDGWCGRRFWTTAADETRYYTAREPVALWLPDDLISITTLATDDGDRTYDEVWAVTDFDLAPYNAALDGKPYDHIEVTPLGAYRFPTCRRGVKLIGKFGWASVPADLERACIMVASQTHRLSSAPFGVSGTPEMGVATLQLGEYGRLMGWLAPYRHLRVG
jgi:hypothetical protein